MKKLAIAAATAAALVLGTAATAHAVVKPIRQTDFIASLSDTRATGSYQFLREGLRVVTQGTTSTDKVAEYFAMSGSLPTSSSIEWYGTVAQPGIQIVFDFDSTAGNGNDNNILVGESIYAGDWWLTGSSSQQAKDVAPLTTPGSGSMWHGTLAQWGAALTTEKVTAGGFSLGSGVQGDGVIRAINFGADSYEFTDQALPPTPPTVVDAKGSYTITHKTAKRTQVKFSTQPATTGTVLGDKARFKVTVDGTRMFKVQLGLGAQAKYRTSFKAGSGKHTVKVVLNGDAVKTFKVKA